MNVVLMAHTPNPEKLIAAAYGICTGKDTIPVENIPGWIEKGHLSPIEHPSATFRISGISRACSHQLVRHRLASYSQRSQRYCTEDNWQAVMPDSMKGKHSGILFLYHMELSRLLYTSLTEEHGVPDEDARFVLPNATPTELIMSANFRQWRHVIEVRHTEHAQWEIRRVARRVLIALYGIAPHVFGDLMHD